MVLLDKPVAFFFTFPLSSLSLLLKLLNNETPAGANSFISPSPIMNIHVFLAACILKPSPFLDLNHCFSEVIDEKRHRLVTQFQSPGSREHTTLPYFNKKYSYNFSNYQTPHFRLKGVQN